MTVAQLDSWDSLFARRGRGRYPCEDVVRFMARTFSAADTTRVRVLDLGCGPGPNLWYLAREGYRAAGIDGSPTAVAQACDRLRGDRLDDDVDLRLGDFAVLPWDDATFDAVIDNESIYANPMSAIRTTLTEVHRVLKPGGWLFAKMFGVRSTGYDASLAFEPGTMRSPADGPCTGNAVAHFFNEAEFDDLLAPYAQLHLDYTCRSDHGGRWTVFEWLVSAQK